MKAHPEADRRLLGKPQCPAAEAGSAAPARPRRAPRRDRVAPQGEGVGERRAAGPVRAARSALQAPESGAPRAPFLDAAWLFEYRACRHDSALSTAAK